MLVGFSDSVWTVGSDLKMFGVEMGARMTIVKLSDGSLVLHSPINIGVELKREIDKLGIVAHVIAPNKWHHLFVGRAKDLFPDARFYCAPGLEKKRSDFKFDEIILDEKIYPWSSSLDHQGVHGSPIFNEVAFFHRDSRTLIVTDLVFNISSSESLYTRLALRAMGVYGNFGWSMLEKRLYVRNRGKFQKSIDAILRWNFDGVIMSHGTPVLNGGKEMFRKCFAGESAK